MLPHGMSSPPAEKDVFSFCEDYFLRCGIGVWQSLSRSSTWGHNGVFFLGHLLCPKVLSKLFAYLVWYLARDHTEQNKCGILFIYFMRKCLWINTEVFSWKYVNSDEAFGRKLSYSTEPKLERPGKMQRSQADGNREFSICLIYIFCHRKPL